MSRIALTGHFLCFLFFIDYYGIVELSHLLQKALKLDAKAQYCKILCTGDWIAQLNCKW